MAATAVCDARSKGGNYCTRDRGHVGPHGLEIEPGVIVAPWEGVFNPDAAKPTRVRCQQCQSSMLVNIYPNGANLACTGCDREHWFSADGESDTMSGGMTLYPSNPVWRLRYLREILAEYEWRQQARVACGTLTQEECDRRIAAGLIELKRFRHETLSALPWWHRVAVILQLRYRQLSTWLAAQPNTTDKGGA